MQALPVVPTARSAGHPKRLFRLASLTRKDKLGLSLETMISPAKAASRPPFAFPDGPTRWGMERVEHWGSAGALGLADPLFFLRRRGVAWSAFNPEVFRTTEERMQRKNLARRHNAAAALGLKLVAAQ